MGKGKGAPTGGNAHQRKVVKTALKHEVEQRLGTKDNNQQKTNLVVAPPEEPDYPLIRWIEQPLFLAAFGIVGGIVSLVYFPFLILVGFCIVGAFHRAAVVKGRSWKIQAGSYILVFAGAMAIVYCVVGIVRRSVHIPTASDIADAVAARIRPQPKDLLFGTQLEELKAIDALIARKDEVELRETFDLPKMLHYNIELTRRSMAPQLLSPTDSSAIDHYFEGGQAKLDVRLASIQNVNDHLTASLTPGRVAIVNLPVKYLQARSQLIRLSESPDLPSKVIEALKDFDAAIEKNTDLMRSSLDESVTANPASLLEDDDNRSTFFRSAEGHYWRQFVQLKPKGDAVRDAIRVAIGVK
jgi:hypothetical protein